MDFKSQERLTYVYPDIEDRFFKLYQAYQNKYGKNLKVSEGIRTMKRQGDLWNKGRSTPGPIVTYSKPGWSFHNYGLALDVFFAGKDPYLEKDPKFEYYWKKFGELAEKHGFVWGGHFSGLLDRPHIQLSYGLTITEIRKIYDAHGMEGLTKELDRLQSARVAEENPCLLDKLKCLFKRRT